ncbi:MAG: helix-turn-helix domain-containing protein [Oscillospiraceae bacterium]|nr:helix-turn-helix domain-containing protein [Oscillospiraceae bacterium]
MYTVIRGGYNAKHPKSFVLSRPQGVKNYVILHVTSPAHFQIGERKFDVLSNSMILIRPNIPYQYCAADHEYKNDWIHFACDQDSFESNYAHLCCRPIPIHNSLHFAQYFQHIIWEFNYAPSDLKQSNLDMLFQIMLNKLIQEDREEACAKSYSPYAAKLRDLRLTMQFQSNKNFTPEELSSQLNISPSYFQHLYKDFFGISFKKDLINMRLEHARELIANTSLTFEQIALMSGYSNQIHFYRQFKAHTGMTPKEYRLSIRIKP